MPLSSCPPSEFIAPPVPIDGHRLASIGLVELDVLASRTVTILHQGIDADLSCVTMKDDGPELVVRAARGQRSNDLVGLKIPIGYGIGGVAFSQCRTVSVDEYARMPAARGFCRLMVGEEGVRAAAGVPVMVDDHPIGVLFLGRRGNRPFTDFEVRQLQQVASAIAPLAAASLQMAQRVEAARLAERQRLVGDLHDQIVPILFAMGAAAHRVRALLPAAALEADKCVSAMEDLNKSALSTARGMIRQWAPIAPEQELVQDLRACAERFAALANTPLSVGVLGCPRAVDPATKEIVTGLAQVALNNVARHSPGASVVMTLDFDPDRVGLTVQDDGVGLSPDFVLAPITDPRVGEHFGLANLACRVRRIAGEFEVFSNEDGGVTVRASVPTNPFQW
jgi:signal transduction histidine kinase